MDKRLIKKLTKDRFPITSSFGVLDSHILDNPEINKLIRTVYLFLLHTTYREKITYLEFMRMTEGRYGT